MGYSLFSWVVRESLCSLRNEVELYRMGVYRGAVLCTKLTSFIVILLHEKKVRSKPI